MRICLLAILSLSLSAHANSLPHLKAFSHASVIQNAADPNEGKVIGGVEYSGFNSPMAANKYLREHGVNLLGSAYSSKLAGRAQEALLEWLKENGQPNAKVDASVRPLPKYEDKEVILTFKVAE